MYFIANVIIKRLPVILLMFASQINADTFVRDDIITEPDYRHFSMCHAHGCKVVEQLSLTDTQWQQIAQYFQPAAQSAAQERRQIADAIAEFEKIIGVKTNTSEDKAGLFESMGSAGQLDCIDESTNSTTYLLILQQQGLLTWHEPMAHVTRGFFIFGWPHSAAAMREKQSKIEYAVDSWFEDNGERPHIIPLSQWRSGWSPK
ncbi:MAG: hypothetical protein KZQ64_03150 [gamma proteobacterium symbiont of Bathyaustriella thionipta]|nr:hypothetical protein [gamma proteobacterium symbiont of Bathyaustriella thionipta]MCU7948879.1 hypothetical protein [gamma proteobacterium symbiont of Bathyaustriella thionipta]MCU7952381.1 hypothetical protein [gamma proteobacterium symbiont of Bathyaustriella thionipta]MCU7955336.1 hypothetical protein [gamma proteobacterium symbiont of Bathyaustriella thionipta]MCU7966116.1 hypothetical protein [gamma proteobacterium symbiont of Bathyaustriella thionipta]